MQDSSKACRLPGPASRRHPARTWALAHFNYSPVYTIQPVVKPVVQPGLAVKPGLTTGCIVYTDIQPVVKPCLSNRLYNPVWQSVERTAVRSTRLSNRLSPFDRATSQLVTGSSRHTVMSSHGQLVTGQLVTQTSHHSQLVTSEHITKPPVPVCTSSGDIQKQCSTRTA